MLVNQKSIFLLTLLFFSIIVTADGGFIPPSNYQHDIYEPTQSAVIVFDGSSEKLLLQVSYESELDEFVWVVPVPNYPTVNKSSSQIFNQLSDLSKPIYHRAPEIFPSLGSKDLEFTLGAQLKNDVSLHERKWMDVFKIDVVSSTNTDSLYDWLINNRYSVSPKVKSALDSYVKDDWYFVVMKFNSDYRAYKLTDYVKEMDLSVISVQDAKPVFADYIIDSINSGKTYTETKLPTITYTSLSQGNNYYYNSAGKNPQVPFISSIQYQGYQKTIRITNSTEGMIKKQILQDLENSLDMNKNINTQSDNSGVFNPIQIKFDSQEIVYPLKVSSMNSGVSEILIYTLAPYKTKIKEYEQFNLEYAKRIDTDDLRNNKELEKLFDQRYFLTKYRGELFPNEMTQDLSLIQSPNNKEFVINEYEDGYSLAWFLVCLSFLLFYLVSTSVCLFFRWINNLIIKKDKNSKLYIPFKRVFLQGFFLPIFTTIILIGFIYASSIFYFHNIPGIVNLILALFAFLFSVILGFIITHSITFILSISFTGLLSLFRKPNIPQNK